MRRLKKFETYNKFMTNNPDYWETTFIGYDATKLALLKGLVYKWYKYRRIGTLDEEKFSWYLERNVENLWDRWVDLLNIEELRDSVNTLNKIFVYNTNDYTLASQTSKQGTENQTDTGTIQNQGSDNRTLNTQIELDMTGTNNRANTGTQKNETIGEIDDTGTQTNEETRNLTDETTYNTQVKDTGTQTTNDTGTQTNANTHSDSNSNITDQRSLATNLPQSITAGDGEFDTHFDGVDGEPNPVPNTQAGWYTAGSKSETKGNGSGSTSGTANDTRTDNLQSQRTDNLTRTTTGTDTVGRTGTDTNLRTDNLKRETSEEATRTDNLTELTTRNMKDLTKNTGTDNLAKTNTQTNNLARNISTQDTTNTDTTYTIEGRTNHSPYEALKEAINKITSFCSLDWLREQLDPCFYLLVALDDYDEEYEDE